MIYTLITGATSGIGRSCARKFAEIGKNLILIGRRKERLEILAKELEAEFSIHAMPYQLDVTDLAAVEAMYETLKEHDIEVLINNAGLAAGKASFEDADWKDMETMIETNIKGFTKIAHGGVPLLKKTHGHLFNISSIAGIESYEGGHVYCGTKSFVKSVSKALRIDLLGTGIRVTDIAPGAVQTEFSNVRFKGDDQKADSVYEGFVPLRPEDIADCIMFAYQRPPSVNIEYMLVMPSAQASATRFSK